MFGLIKARDKPDRQVTNNYHSFSPLITGMMIVNGYGSKSPSGMETKRATQESLF
jgi:hypothetical protein